MDMDKELLPHSSRGPKHKRGLFYYRTPAAVGQQRTAMRTRNDFLLKRSKTQRACSNTVPRQLEDSNGGRYGLFLLTGSETQWELVLRPYPDRSKGQQRTAVDKHEERRPVPVTDQPN